MLDGLSGSKRTKKGYKHPWKEEKVNNVIYAYGRILFGFKKEENSDICYYMHEPWGHYDKWNKPVIKKNST